MQEKKELLICSTPYLKSATVYSDTDVTLKACILYFHGGGLLYGQRDDLPPLHIERMTKAGYVIVSYDYPLAPAAKLDMILDDVCSSIAHYVEHPGLYCEGELPFYLWGRSAGAYLCLLAAAQFEIFRIRHIRVVGAMGAKQRTRKRDAGAQGIVQIEIFLPSFVDQGAPAASLPCIDVDTVVGLKPARGADVCAGIA